MTDAHCHVSGGDPSVREFLIGRDFVGVHPWESGEADSCPLHFGGIERPFTSGRETASPLSWIDELRRILLSEPGLGVGEIGLDRLRDRNISPRMREVFESQLRLALEFHRPVVLHGAKCWGQVVKTVREGVENRCRCRKEIDTHSTSTPRPYTFLFHGFSRSDGLIPDIVALNGYISVGPAILNDHAVNYRELVRKIPSDRLLLETDRTAENAAECPSIRDVASAVATYRDMSFAELERITDENAERFLNLI